MLDDIVISDKTNQEFDVLVVGSGITGGWAAKEFTERGFKVLMLERGRLVEHRKDYITENKAPWEFATRTRATNLMTKQEQHVQAKCYAYNDATKHFFGNDKELPYSSKEDTDFSWIRANQLGGKSLLWHRQSYRMSEFDFTANALDGYGNDWPIRYKDLEKWYSYVEKHAGISGNDDKLEQLPSSEFLPAFEFTKPELDAKALLAKTFPDRPMIMGRAAHLTKPTSYHMSQGRVMCQARNECQKGCSLGAYFTSQSSTLPAAAATGNLSIAPNSVVHSLIYDEQGQKVKGVNVIDAETMENKEYYAKIVFLCASTLGSTQILLNTKTPRFKNGLANSSGVLGHYLMDHCYNASIFGQIPGYEEEFYSGRRPTGIYIPNFQYSPEKYNRHYKRGYAFAGGSARQNHMHMRFQDGIGENYKKRLSQPGAWWFSLHAQGEMLPRFENQVSLHTNKTDKWGIPQLHFNITWSDNEKRMMDDAAEQGTKMLESIGAKGVRSKVSYDQNSPGLAIHEVGTARMGNNPKESVLNGFNQSHDIANLFITDGASYCSSAVVNPSLTFMALTARAVDYCVNEVKNRRI